MTTTIIISQVVEWLKKMGVKVELNTELNQYEFEYGNVFVILHTDTPEGVLSLTCPYVFADETQTRNRPTYEMAKWWWSEYISTEHCFCEFVEVALAPHLHAHSTLCSVLYWQQ